MPGKMAPPEVLAGGGDGLEGRRRPKVDDDGRPAVEVEGPDGVGDPVGTDLARVLVEHGHAGLHARLDDERLPVEVALREASERSGDPGDRRAQGHALHIGPPVEAVESQELLDHERVLVGGPFHVGRDPPVVEQRRVRQPAPVLSRCGVVTVDVVEADHGLGVADVDDQQVHDTRAYWRPPVAGIGDDVVVFPQIRLGPLRGSGERRTIDP